MNAGKMSKSFGGRQKKPWNPAIKENDYLGPYNWMLRVGDVQKMCFQSTDDGPFWMTPEEKEQTREDIIILSETKICKYTKDELKCVLEAKGVLVKGNLANLKSACE